MFELLILLRDIILAIVLGWAGIDYAPDEKQEKPAQEAHISPSMAIDLLPIPATLTLEPECASREPATFRS